MTEDDAAVLRQALIKESVGIAALAVILLWFGPGKMWAESIMHRVRKMRDRPANPVDAEVESFGRDVQRWDYEQAAKAHRGPAEDGGCGCG